MEDGMSDTEKTPSRRALARQLRDASKAGDYAGALILAGQLNSIIEPEHTDSLLQIARLYSLAGDRTNALLWLRRAVKAGYWDAATLQKDEAFQAMSAEPKFREMVRGAWANGYIWMLERDERKGFQKPDKVMKALSLKPGERVAEIGVGSGYFTLRVARAVGPTGVVLGLDAVQEMLDYAKERAEIEKLDNIRFAKVTREDPKLPKTGIDTILMVDVLHYVLDRRAYAKKLRKGLAPGGRVVIIDYTVKPWDERPWGPPPEQQVAREVIDADMATVGLKPAKVHKFLPEQYFVEYSQG
jgi:ubiquinone/menaquinone biosynthesis C-methylase UbiE